MPASRDELPLAAIDPTVLRLLQTGRNFPELLSPLSSLQGVVVHSGEEHALGRI